MMPPLLHFASFTAMGVDSKCPRSSIVASQSLRETKVLSWGLGSLDDL